MESVMMAGKMRIMLRTMLLLTLLLLDVCFVSAAEVSASSSKSVFAKEAFASFEHAKSIVSLNFEKLEQEGLKDYSHAKEWVQETATTPEWSNMQPRVAALQQTSSATWRHLELAAREIPNKLSAESSILFHKAQDQTNQFTRRLLEVSNPYLESAKVLFEQERQLASRELNDGKHAASRMLGHNRDIFHRLKDQVEYATELLAQKRRLGGEEMEQATLSASRFLESSRDGMEHEMEHATERFAQGRRFLNGEMKQALDTAKISASEMMESSRDTLHRLEHQVVHATEQGASSVRPWKEYLQKISMERMERLLPIVLVIQEIEANFVSTMTDRTVPMVQSATKWGARMQEKMDQSILSPIRASADWTWSSSQVSDAMVSIRTALAEGSERIQTVVSNSFESTVDSSDSTHSKNRLRFRRAAVVSPANTNATPSQTDAGTASSWFVGILAVSVLAFVIASFVSRSTNTEEIGGSIETAVLLDAGPNKLQEELEYNSNDLEEHHLGRLSCEEETESCPLPPMAEATTSGIENPPLPHFPKPAAHLSLEQQSTPVVYTPTENETDQDCVNSCFKFLAGTQNSDCPPKVLHESPEEPSCCNDSSMPSEANQMYRDHVPSEPVASASADQDLPRNGAGTVCPAGPGDDAQSPSSPRIGWQNLSHAFEIAPVVSVKIDKGKVHTGAKCPCPSDTFKEKEIYTNGSGKEPTKEIDFSQASCSSNRADEEQGFRGVEKHTLSTLDTRAYIRAKENIDDSTADGEQSIGGAGVEQETSCDGHCHQLDNVFDCKSLDRSAESVCTTNDNSRLEKMNGVESPVLLNADPEMLQMDLEYPCNGLEEEHQSASTATADEVTGWTLEIPPKGEDNGSELEHLPVRKVSDPSISEDATSRGAYTPTDSGADADCVNSCFDFIMGSQNSSCPSKTRRVFQESPGRVSDYIDEYAPPERNEMPRDETLSSRPQAEGHATDEVGIEYTVKPESGLEPPFTPPSTCHRQDMRCEIATGISTDDKYIRVEAVTCPAHPFEKHVTCTPSLQEKKYVMPIEGSSKDADEGQICCDLAEQLAAILSSRVFIDIEEQIDHAIGVASDSSIENAPIGEEMASEGGYYLLGEAFECKSLDKTEAKPGDLRFDERGGVVFPDDNPAKPAVELEWRGNDSESSIISVEATRLNREVEEEGVRIPKASSTSPSLENGMERDLCSLNDISRDQMSARPQGEEHGTVEQEPPRNEIDIPFPSERVFDKKTSCCPPSSSTGSRQETNDDVALETGISFDAGEQETHDVVGCCNDDYDEQDKICLKGRNEEDSFPAITLSTGTGKQEGYSAIEEQALSMFDAEHKNGQTTGVANGTPINNAILGQDVVFDGRCWQLDDTMERISPDQRPELPETSGDEPSLAETSGKVETAVSLDASQKKLQDDLECACDDSERTDISGDSAELIQAFEEQHMRIAKASADNGSGGSIRQELCSNNQVEIVPCSSDNDDEDCVNSYFESIIGAPSNNCLPKTSIGAPSNNCLPKTTGACSASPTHHSHWSDDSMASEANEKSLDNIMSSKSQAEEPIIIVEQESQEEEPNAEHQDEEEDGSGSCQCCPHTESIPTRCSTRNSTPGSFASESGGCDEQKHEAQFLTESRSTVRRRAVHNVYRELETSNARKQNDIPSSPGDRTRRVEQPQRETLRQRNGRFVHFFTLYSFVVVAVFLFGSLALRGTQEL